MILKRKPEWLKIRLSNNVEYAKVSELISKNGLHTICSSGKCPNQAECWNRKTATFMILGDICTRACKFCATKTGKPQEYDINEPIKIARSVAIMGLKHCVITSVTRDDLADGGSKHWANTIEAIRENNKNTSIEVLIPDFNGNIEQIDTVLQAKPNIVGHNIETVERLSTSIRSKATYKQSLQVINYIASKGFISKSGLMLGLGESQQEIIDTITDLKNAGCSILTMGQYLQPSLKHAPVVDYISPSDFDFYKTKALEIGLKYVESGPLVRSSYMADKAMDSCCR